MQFDKLYNLIEDVFKPASSDEVKQRQIELIKQEGLPPFIEQIIQDNGYIPINSVDIDEDYQTIKIFIWNPAGLDVEDEITEMIKYVTTDLISYGIELSLAERPEKTKPYENIIIFDYNITPEMQREITTDMY